jgi:hypothetical protein
MVELLRAAWTGLSRGSTAAARAKVSAVGRITSVAAVKADDIDAPAQLVLTLAVSAPSGRRPRQP